MSMYNYSSVSEFENKKSITKVHPVDINNSEIPSHYAGLSPLSDDVLVELINNFSPIVYFHKKEEYMPIDYDDLLNISDLYQIRKKSNDIEMIPTETLTEKKNILKKTNGDNILVNIDAKKKNNNPVAKQLITRTNGFWYNEIDKIITVEIAFIYIFSWNGTMEWHPFDTEQIIIRLATYDQGKNWTLIKIFGSCHGNGKWFNTVSSYNNSGYQLPPIITKSTEITFEKKHPIMFSSLGSHSMYPEAKTHKRFFYFGNDYTKRDIRYQPTEFVLFYGDNIYSIKENTSKLIKNEAYNYFINNSIVGRYKVSTQIWVGSLYKMSFDLNTQVYLDGFYKFQGGIDSIFNNKKELVNHKIQLAVKISSCIIWSLSLLFLIYYTFKIYNSKKMFFRILFILRNVIFYLIFSVITFFMFLLILVVN
jgi:hypothetical protein